MAFRSVSVLTTVTKIAAFEPRRKSLTLVNIGTERMFISHDELSVATEGFPIDPGVSASFSENDGDDPRLALFGQTTTTVVDVRVQEGFPK
jgi:hypothetical protein